MSTKPILAKDVAASFMTVIDDELSKYSEKKREELKAAILGSLSTQFFYGELEKEKNFV
jgi:hypothetical protein